MDESERAEIVVSGDGDNPILEVDGLAVDVPTGRDPMLVGIELVAATAGRRGRPVPATVVTEQGNWQWRLLVHPDGTTTDDTDDGEKRPDGLFRRRPSRLAVAAIGVAVLAVGGATALAVSSNSDQVPGGAAGSAGAIPSFPATVPPTSGPPPLAPPASAPASAAPSTAAPSPAAPSPAAPRPAAPQPVGPAAAPRTGPGPPAPVPRTPRPAAAPRPPAPPVPVAAPRTTVSAGRLVVVSDGAGNCATASGSAVAATACTDSTAQRWTATPAGELRQGSRCLVARSGVALVDCASVPAAARTWTPTGPTPGLVNPASSLCLGATGTAVVAAQCGTGRSLRIA